MSYNFKELILTNTQIKKLKTEILTRSHPLGHNVYEFTDDRYNPDLYHILFNWHPDQFHEENGFKPSIILGRRGSGKSSYLNNLSHKKNVIPVIVKSWDIVDLIDKYVKLILKNQTDVDSERVAEIWQLAFLTLATNKLFKSLPNDKKLEEFLDRSPLKSILIKSGAKALLRETFNIVKKKIISDKDNEFDLSIILESNNILHNSLSEWETELSDIALANDKVVIIMIDNPEKIEQSNNNYLTMFKETEKSRWNTYSGLLSLLARFNEGKTGVQARYCVAAEQYFFLQEKSNSILKDFSNMQLLHWTSGELLSALAHRYMIYLQLHPMNRNQEKYEMLKKIDIYKRNGAFEFFLNIFSSEITNKRGFSENTLTYLLRHTQLLPRQLILYVNEAIKRALDFNKNYDLTNLNSSYIKEAIHSLEDLCASEIIESYSSIFPEGKELMETLDDLPLIDTVGAIETNWAKLGAKKVLNKYSAYPTVVVESTRFKKFLIEVGIIGKVVKSSKNGYVNAVYEYTLPSHLHANSSEKFAVHPLFANIASPNRYYELDPHKGVYPNGIEINCNTEKELIKKKYIH